MIVYKRQSANSIKFSTKLEFIVIATKIKKYGIYIYIYANKHMCIYQ